MELAIKSDNADFQKLVLSVAEYKACKYKSNELIYQGFMYDIKSLKYLSGKVELIVLHDKEEKEVLDYINGLAAETEDKEGNNTLPLQLQSFLSIPYLLPESGYKYHVFSISFLVRILDKKYVINFPGDIPSPPPKA